MEMSEIACIPDLAWPPGNGSFTPDPGPWAGVNINNKLTQELPTTRTLIEPKSISGLYWKLPFPGDNFREIFSLEPVSTWPIADSKYLAAI